MPWHTSVVHFHIWGWKSQSGSRPKRLLAFYEYSILTTMQAIEYLAWSCLWNIIVFACPGKLVTTLNHHGWTLSKIRSPVWRPNLIVLLSCPQLVQNLQWDLSVCDVFNSQLCPCYPRCITNYIYLQFYYTVRDYFHECWFCVLWLLGVSLCQRHYDHLSFGSHFISYVVILDRKCACCHDILSLGFKVDSGLIYQLYCRY